MKIKDILTIDTSFQKSVNLKYDLKDVSKIKRYIPTTSSIDILKSYVKDFTSEGSQKSTVLVGPYGKGKSHMLLTLIGLFSYYDNDEDIVELQRKIKNVDYEAYLMIDAMRKHQCKYLPLIVSNTQNDFNRSILLSLIDALKRENIADLIPNTYYNEAISRINLWKNTYPDVYAELSKNVEDIDKFINDISKYDTVAYNKFLDIHKDLTAGSEFNPMINMEVTTILESVNRKLVDDYGYSGIVILFDEFSKYLESSDDNTITNEIKIIQDVCELANASKEYKFFNIFVMHKKIQQYTRELSTKVKNAYKGIEGRIEYKEFYTSSKNNYELIGDVLGKNSNFEKFKEKSEIFKILYSTSKKIVAFNSVFDNDEIDKTVVNNCFPLTPLAAYILLKISERIGQNERSIFTFLASNEQGGLQDILAVNDSIDLVDASYIYDYFYGTIKSSRNETNMYKINMQLQVALNAIEDTNKIKFLKTIALIHMINDFDNVSTDFEYLSNALGLESKYLNTIYRELENDNIVLKKRNIITFKTKVSISIEKEIQNQMDMNSSNIAITNILSNIDKNHFIISREYNNIFKMVRYFEKIYMTFDQFETISNFDVLFKNKFSDGKVIYILLDEEQFDQDIYADDKRILIIKLKLDKKIEKIARRKNAVEELIKKSNDEIIITELNDIIDSINEEITKILYEMTFKDNKYRNIYIGKEHFSYVSGREFDLMLNEMLLRLYPKTPIINYELINKNKVSGAYKKAREDIVRRTLENNFDGLEAGTSAEASLYRATLLHTGLISSEYVIDEHLESIIHVMKSIVLAEPNKKNAFSTIYECVQEQPYGLRKGVIPIYLAFVISELDVDITFYNGDFEVSISSNLIELINENPSQYHFLIEEKSHEREMYISCLELEFSDYNYSKNDSVTRYKKVVSSMQYWYNSLPKITQQVNDFNIDGVVYPYKKFSKLINRLDINAREMLFSEFHSLFGDYEEVIKNISTIKYYLNSYITKFKNEITIKMIHVFDSNSNATLLSTIKCWFTLYEKNIEIVTFSPRTNSFVNALKNIDKYNNNQLLDKISMALVGMCLEDFKPSMVDELIPKLIEVKEEIENTNYVETNGVYRVIIQQGDEKILEKVFDEHHDGTAEFMINELEDILEQYGDSVDIEGKIAILANLIQKVSKS